MARPDPGKFPGKFLGKLKNNLLAAETKFHGQHLVGGENASSNYNQHGEENQHVGNPTQHRTVVTQEKVLRG